MERRFICSQTYGQFLVSACSWTECLSYYNWMTRRYILFIHTRKHDQPPDRSLLIHSLKKSKKENTVGSISTRIGPRMRNKLRAQNKHLVYLSCSVDSLKFCGCTWTRADDKIYVMWTLSDTQTQLELTFIQYTL